MVRHSHRTVKHWATGLLIMMGILYVVARSYEDVSPVWPWVRAFAEAGMIGALADWFAVVALFRHPLGLPIPHTAIVKKQKDRIGASLGRFVRIHFLTPEVIGDQLRKNQVVKRGLDWLSDPENARELSALIQRQIPHFLSEGSYRKACDSISKSLCKKLAETPIEKGVGRWMVESMHGEEFRGVLAPLFAKLSQGVSGSKKWVEGEAGQRAPLQKSRNKIISKISRGLTEVLSGHMVGQLSEQLHEASGDTQHSFYDKLEDSLTELGTELQSEDEENSEWRLWREKIFESQGMQETSAEFLYCAGELAAREKDSILSGMGQSLSAMARRISEDEAELEKWEDELIRFVTKLSDLYGDAFEQLIQERVKAWEANSLTNQIEERVGADLQFIRINGSLIGGLIGVLLHGVGLMIWG